MLVRLPPSSNSGRLARRCIGEAVLSLGRGDLLDDAAAVVSELVANAVLHARTEMTLSLHPCRAGLRIAVADGSPVLPRWSPSSVTGTSGRGLLLVQRLSTRWGADPIEGGGKIVWAEIDDPAADADDTTVDDLLALWVDEPSPASTPTSGIAVEVDIDVPAMLASRAHTDDLVRDLQLILLNAASRVTTVASPPEVVRLARRLDAATEEFHEVRRQIYAQTLIAAQQHRQRTTLRLCLQPADAGAARRFLDALEEADALTAGGMLLLPPFPQELAGFRRNNLQAIIEQLAAPPA